LFEKGAIYGEIVWDKQVFIEIDLFTSNFLYIYPESFLGS